MSKNAVAVISRSQLSLPEREIYSTPRLIILHLLPGVAAAALFYAGAPLLQGAGHPAISAAIIAIAVAVVGGELGWLLYQARGTGRRSLAAVLPYRPGRFTWRRGVLTLGLFVWAVLASVVVGSLKPSIIDSFFSWMPAWAITPLPSDIAATTDLSVRVLIAIGLLVLNDRAGEEEQARPHQCRARIAAVDAQLDLPLPRSHIVASPAPWRWRRACTARIVS